MIPTIFMVLVASLLAATVNAAPAHASQGLSKTFSSCDKLLAEHPNGVAKSKAAANKAVKEGFARPKVSSSLYRTNGARLDRDKDGVMCEQKGLGSGSRGLWKPTGFTAVDLVADDLVSSRLQVRYLTAFIGSILEQIKAGDPLCRNWENELFKASFLGEFVPNSVKLSGVSRTWANEAVSRTIPVLCQTFG